MITLPTSPDATAWPALLTASEPETEAVGRRLAAILTPGCVVALHGDLGAGKTVLTRGIARGLGITEPVTSPTFTIVQEYRRCDGTWLFHLDMYRIRHEDDALAFGIEEFLFAPDAVTVVEWPERIAGLLETPRRMRTPAVVPAESAATGPALVPLWLEHVSDHERRVRLPAAWHTRLGA